MLFCVYTCVTMWILLMFFVIQCVAIDFGEFEDLLHSVGAFEIPSYDDWSSDDPPFDYVVVGAGTAGSVLANRLTEHEHVRVLLLEAGNEPPLSSEVPFLAAALQLSPYNWNFSVEPQNDFALGLVERRVLWPRGKALGGSSTINSMLHVRGNRHDYDRWEANGNPGWSYKDLLPYFLKSENSSVRVNDAAYRGKDGYLNVQDAPFRTQSAEVFVKAAQQAGYPYVDYNGASQMGVSYSQVTLRDGRRCGGEKAFLRTAKNRHNLVVRKNCHVTRVLIDRETKVAYGVEYVSDNVTYVVNATKEVILSAGVINSPQLLMLSGVGPRNHLLKLGIDVVQSLPVGNRIYDHVAFLGLIFDVVSKITINYDDIVNDESIQNFTRYGMGPMTTTETMEAFVFLKSKAATHAENYPDIELIFLGSSIHLDVSLVYKNMINVANDTYSKVWAEDLPQNSWSIYPMLLHPKSFGTLRLKSKNPFDHVEIHANYLSDPAKQDVRALIAGIREAQRIAKMPAFRRYRTRQVKNIVPGCQNLLYDSDAYWECAIRHVSNSMHHQTSTCKMGPVNDPETVVDSKLRVHGVKRLRVVDASVFPFSVSAHTNVPVYTLAERASDLILKAFKPDK